MQVASKTLFRDISELLTLAEASKRQGRRPTEDHLSIIHKAAMVVEAGKIIWVGEQKKIPKQLKAVKEISFGGRCVLPGFVECHTHTVFAGSRAEEFEMRNRGVSYQAISARGGGILSTVNATRKATAAELKISTQFRVEEFLRQGITTLEIKSGYGLNLKDEIKCLRVAQGMHGPRIVTTFLGAHAKPIESTTYENYLKELIEKVLPAVKKYRLADRVDIFIEKGFFESNIGVRYLQAAKDLGFKITIHADQLSLSGGGDAAVKLGAASADHLISIGEKQIKDLAKSDVVCVLLPAADLYMKCAYPPARKLIDAGAKVALATDFNPGTSPTQDLNLVGLLARLEMKMTLPEVICAYTLNAANALNLENQIGSCGLGKDADFLSINGSWRDLFYHAGRTEVYDVYRKAKRLHANS